MTQTTNYPWDGRIKIKIEPERPFFFTLHLRIPGWCRSVRTFKENGRIKFAAAPGMSVGGPQFNRPSTTPPFGPTGVIVSYHTQIFQVNQNTTCFVDSIQNGLFDGFIHVYQASFNPINPGQNVVAANDDAPEIGVGSSRTAAFTTLANTPYTVVTSAFATGTNECPGSRDRIRFSELRLLQDAGGSRDGHHPW